MLPEMERPQLQSEIEVMGIDTPNLLSRQTTFLMGILKKCLTVEKTPKEPNNQISSIPVFRSFSSAHGRGSTYVHGRCIQPFSLPVEKDPLTSTEGVFSHSVPATEENPLTSTDDRSQMNCANTPDMAESPESSSNRVVGSNNPSLSIADLPLTQEKVEQPMQTYSKVLVNFQENPTD